MVVLREALFAPPAGIALGYMAGVFDGEGYIYRTGRRVGEEPRPGRWVIGLGMTDRGIIEWLGTFGGTVKTHGGTHRPMWRWALHARRDQLAFLDAVLPLMRERRKRETALTALGELLALERMA
jgi:hypothetical protein